MSTEMISAVAQIAPPVAMLSSLAPVSVQGEQSFGNMVSQGLEQVNNQLMTTQTDLQSLATGEAQNLHQVMIRMEETRISFQLMMQVRNRLLEAYQDVMKMQI